MLRRTVFVAIGAGVLWQALAGTIGGGHTFAHLGRWESIGREPPISLDLWDVVSDASGVPLLEVHEGRFAATGLFGPGRIEGKWNHESTSPLRLNLLTGVRHVVVGVDVSGDRMTLYLADQIEDFYRPDWRTRCEAATMRRAP